MVVEPEALTPEPDSASPEAKETGRIEAFSDGVFAIAITLLVLDLHVPLPSDLAGGPTLGTALLHSWPTYLAFLTSFLTILIMWINHHWLFRIIARTDHTFLILNGLLLLFITVVPFPTALLAQYLQLPDRALAAQVYAGNYVMIALAFNLVWRYASSHGRLLGVVDPRAVQAIDDAYRFGPIWYLIAFVLAFVSVWASIGLCLALAIFFALPRKLPGINVAGD